MADTTKLKTFLDSNKLNAKRLLARSEALAACAAARAR